MAENPIISMFKSEYRAEYEKAVADGVTVTPEFVKRRLGSSIPYKRQRTMFELMRVYLKKKFRLWQHRQTIHAIERTLNGGLVGPNERKEIHQHLNKLRSQTRHFL